MMWQKHAWSTSGLETLILIEVDTVGEIDDMSDYSAGYRIF